MDTHCPVAWKLLCVHGQMLSNFNDGMVHLTRRLLKWGAKAIQLVRLYMKQQNTLGWKILSCLGNLFSQRL